MHFSALSLFSSAGVAETYFEQHGVCIKVASELLPQRARFHEHLYPDAKMIQGDITDESVYANVIKEAKKAKCDFIVATPPCQGMSTAGMQRKDDPRNRLVLSVLRAIEDLNPKFVMIENVPELLQTSIYVDGEWKLIDAYIHEKLDSKYFLMRRKLSTQCTTMFLSLENVAFICCLEKQPRFIGNFQNRQNMSVQ